MNKSAGSSQSGNTKPYKLKNKNKPWETKLVVVELAATHRNKDRLSNQRITINTSRIRILMLPTGNPTSNYCLNLTILIFKINPNSLTYHILSLSINIINPLFQKNLRQENLNTTQQATPVLTNINQAMSSMQTIDTKATPST